MLLPLYLEASDYIVDEPKDPTDDTADATAPFDPETPMITLTAIEGIRTKDTMQLYITMGNEQFVALLDSFSHLMFLCKSRPILP